MASQSTYGAWIDSFYENVWFKRLDEIHEGYEMFRVVK
jgi:hypothetical protein